MHHPPPVSAVLPPQAGHMPPPSIPVTRPSRAARNEHPVYVTPQITKVEQMEEQEISPGPSEATSASRTPSPLGSEEYGDPQRRSQPGQHNTQTPGTMQRKRKHDAMGDDLLGGGGRASQGGPAVYARMILDYFVSESAQIPAFLISPPADFDPNVVIDDDGHTALHWACAMGRIRIVKLLLTAGADIFRANAMGQTALMRSVMFTNNYDLRKFPELFELLHRSTINIDRNDRTVFHYVIDIALQKGKAHAARYYLEVILERLKEYPREVADILNFQDEEGETALTLAARARSKNLVRILLNHGADARVANRDGKNAEDYILEDERFRNVEQGSEVVMQPPPLLDPSLEMAVEPGTLDLHHLTSNGMHIQPHMQLSAAYSQQPMHHQHHQQQQHVMPQQQNLQAGTTAMHNNNYIPANQLAGQYQLAGLAHNSFPTQLHYSETGQRMTSHVIPQVYEQLESLASTYDTELENRLRENSLQEELKDKMGKRFRLGWEKYVRDEEERQKAFVSIVKTEKDGYQQHSVSFVNNNNNNNHHVNGTSPTFGSGGTLSGTPADLQALFAAPTAPASITSATQIAQEQLTKLKTERKELFETYVSLQSEAGTGDKINEYRKLIALGCGLQPQEVDDQLVSNLLDSLDSGDDPQLSTLPIQV